MTRCIAFFLALTVASLTVSSACFAADPLSIRVAVQPERSGEISSGPSNHFYGGGANWLDLSSVA